MKVTAAEGTLARTWHGLTAAVVVAGVALAIGLGGPHSPDDIAAFPWQPARALNVLVYFTIQSNLIVGVTALLLARRPRRAAPVGPGESLAPGAGGSPPQGPRRTSLLFRVLRFDGIAMIVLTAVVYHALLAPLPPHPHGWDAVDNVLLHTVVPLMAVAGWLVFGPRGLVSWKVVWLSLLYPIAWLVFTVVRGAAIGWYPYPFMDPREQGYASVSLTLAGIVAAFIGLAALLLVADRALGRLGRRREAS